jgi:LPXTG-motif cell wall-anchored protein
MKRTFAFVATLAPGMASSVAFARPRATYKWLDESRKGAPWVAPPKEAVSNVIYLNNCQPKGCSLKPGYDNSTTNTSSVPSQTSTISAYKGSVSQWNAIVECVKQTYADFDVQIVTTRPASGNYHMAIVAGTPTQVQQDQYTLGVSPFTCSYIPNAISYSFANVNPSDVADICWTVSQETAHSWGLDHKYDDRDPMTYLETGPTFKRFQDAGGSCGEYDARQCACYYDGSRSSMNSYEVIESVFGSSAPDLVAPTVAITYPTEGAQVTPGFVVRADISDDRTVTKAELRLDGSVVTTLEEGAWNFPTPSSLTQGAHKLELTAYDRAGNATKRSVNVQYGTVCTQDSDCTNTGELCLEGHCVAGPDANGGLGAVCGENSDCASGPCASDTSGQSYCVEGCDPAANACPGGFSCLETAPGAGVCWPESGGGGGCNTTGDTGSSSLLLLGLTLGGLVIVRRKRR